MADNIEERLNKFYEEEKKFLNRDVDIMRVLRSEGWTPRAREIPLEGVHRFERKGRVIDVEFIKGGQMAFGWEDDLGGRGSTLEILMDDKQADSRQRHMEALTKLKTYAYMFSADKAIAFYHKYAAEQKLAYEGYHKFERHFLRTEISIFSVAYDLGYRAWESKSGRVYYQRGDESLSLSRNEKSNAYVWYNWDKKEGGDITKFISNNFKVDDETSVDLLRIYAVNNVSAQKLKDFVATTAVLRKPDHKPTLVSRMRQIPCYWTLYDGYNDLSKDHAFDSFQSVESFIHEHHTSPRLNQYFEKAVEVLGVNVATKLAHAALFQTVGDKIMPELRPEILAVSERDQSEKNLLWIHLQKIMEGLPALAMNNASITATTQEVPGMPEQKKDLPSMRL